MVYVRVGSHRYPENQDVEEGPSSVNRLILKSENAKSLHIGEDLQLQAI